jgi:hypothetical protein
MFPHRSIKYYIFNFYTCTTHNEFHPMIPNRENQSSTFLAFVTVNIRSWWQSLQTRSKKHSYVLVECLFYDAKTAVSSNLHYNVIYFALRNRIYKKENFSKTSFLISKLLYLRTVIIWLVGDIVRVESSDRLFGIFFAYREVTSKSLTFEDRKCNYYP